MTSMERAKSVVEISRQMLAFLRDRNQATDAATLIREFCKAKGLASTDAEVAFSLLLNQGDVFADREMNIEQHTPQAA
jgi:hypothetical protein